MGIKAARARLLEDKVQEIRTYLVSYQYSLRALIKAFPASALRERPPFASVGRYEIWPCVDTAVVLVYPSAAAEVEVIIRESSGKSHAEFLGSSDVGSYFDVNGLPVSWRLVLSIDNPRRHIVHFADPISIGSLGTFRPRFQKLSMFGWEAALPQPDDQALVDFRADATAQNLATSQRMPRSAVKDRAALVASRLEELLGSGAKEEVVQAYLAKHPELLYPDFITCHPKFRLGEDLVTDYVFSVQGISGQEYVFVEIERPTKPVFVSKGHFSQEFTQAKGQILCWSTWISDNHQYLERRLPSLGRPTFHLVMGRSSTLEAEERAILRSEFSGTDRRFSTYDDLLERFRTLIDTLLGP